MMLESQYDLGDIVYLKTDTDQKPRMVTAICFEVSGIEYRLASGTNCYWAKEMEITVEQDVKLKTEQ